MAVIEIIYDAKCKHCIFMNYEFVNKKDGTRSKRMKAFCNNKKSNRFRSELTLKSKACDNIEL